MPGEGPQSVSYTHLDVYKRQEDALQDTDQPGFSDKEFGNVANVGSITAADDTNATDYSSAMDSGQNISESENISSADVPPVKPKRASRRRKTSDSETTDTETPQSEYTEPPVSEESLSLIHICIRR